MYDFLSHLPAGRQVVINFNFAGQTSNFLNGLLRDFDRSFVSDEYY
jgi:hypothetical protein